MKRKITRFLACAMAGLTMLSLTACGSSAMKSNDRNFAAEGGYYDEPAMAMEAESYMDSDSSSFNGSDAVEVTQSASTSLKQQTDRKLIRTVRLSVETTDYDNLYKNVVSMISQLGGYIEQIDESLETWNEPNTRNTNMVIRIPKSVDDQLINEITTNSNVTSRSESVDDVTLDYVDMESHKKTLMAERDRLMAFMEQAADIEEMISIEARLSDVQYQIESMESQLRTYDNKIEFTTIHLDINEVARIVPKPKETFWSRISVGFKEDLLGVWNGIVSIVEWIIIHIPSLVMTAIIIALICLFIVKPIKKKVKVQKEEAQKQFEEKRRMAQTPMNQPNMGPAPINQPMMNQPPMAPVAPVKTADSEKKEETDK